VFAVQALPVRSEVPALGSGVFLFLSFAISETASAMEEVGTSTIASTPSWSNHRRAMPAPMSGLF
jgi:hypothetical protein